MRLSFIQFSLTFFLLLNSSEILIAESPHEYVEKVHGEIVEVVKNKQKIFDDNPNEFILSITEAIEPLVDYERISRNVMGKFYKAASLNQRKKFQKIFKSSLLNTYSKTLAEFQNEEIIVLPKVKKSNRPNREKVHLEIKTNTKNYPAVYDMYLNERGDWKIINIVINGVNLGLVFRNQFYSLMEIHDNEIDTVINNWISSI